MKLLTKLVKLTDWIIKNDYVIWCFVLFVYSAQTVLYFSVSDNHGQTSNVILFYFLNTAFKNFWLGVANKILLSTESLPLHKLKIPLKKSYFFKTNVLCCVKK